MESPGYLLPQLRYDVFATPVKIQDNCKVTLVVTIVRCCDADPIAEILKSKNSSCVMCGFHSVAPRLPQSGPHQYVDDRRARAATRIEAIK